MKGAKVLPPNLPYNEVMRKTKLCSAVCLVAFFLLVTSVHAYDVFLKNGKVIKGDLISKDENLIVLQDASGIKIQLKTSNVDLEKTEATNPKPAAPSTDAAATQKKSGSAPAEKPSLADVAAKSGGAKTGEKKPVRVYTQDDANRLRDQNDLGEGTYDPDAPEAPEASGSDSDDPSLDISGKSEQQYRDKAQGLRDRVQRAQDAYSSLSSKCTEFKNATIQTHIAVDENGNPLPLKETSDKICADADQAKSMLDGAQQALNSFLEEARQAGIPPGWVGQN